MLDPFWLLDRPHLLLLDVEPFWHVLAIAIWLQSDSDGGPLPHAACHGLHWFRSSQPVDRMLPWIDGLGGRHVDCASIMLGDEIVVILTYLTRDVPGGPRLGYCRIGNALLATSALPVAKLRLMGDQIIHPEDDGHDLSLR